jgi:putative FmdB family regulatory protein
MPMYDFRCAECSASHELFLAFVDADAMELVCTECGGPMRRAPSRVNSLRTRPGRGEQAAKSAAEEQRRNACNHRYACRCSGVKLTRPNPFRQQIDAASKPPPRD